MEIENKVVNYITNTKYGHLPSDVVNSTKKLIMDTFGVAIAGSNYSVCKNIAKQVQDWGGRKESTIWVYGDKVPSQNAAMINGTMARALDFGGVYEKTAMHPNENVIPAAFALGEREKVSGKDLITAVTIGIDLTCRLKLAVKRSRGFIGEGVLGTSAATSKILKLSGGELLNALGIGFCLASGTYQMVLENVSFVHVTQGMRAAMGVLSAIFARQGVTGPKNFFEGEYGLYRVYENSEDCDLDELTRELGERFESSNVSIKPYPTCKFTHSAIYGTLELMKENQLNPQGIEEIKVGVSERAYKLTCIPEDKKQAPQQPIEAQFSIPYLVGVATVARDVLIEHVTDRKWLRNAKVLEVAKRVKCYVDNDLETGRSTLESMAAKVVIKANGGRKFEKRIETVIGHPDNPMSLDQVAEKFRKCSRYKATPLTRINLDKSIDILINLEQISDISKLSNLIR